MDPGLLFKGIQKAKITEKINKLGQFEDFTLTKE